MSKSEALCKIRRMRPEVTEIGFNTAQTFDGAGMMYAAIPMRGQTPLRIGDIVWRNSEEDALDALITEVSLEWLTENVRRA